MSYTVLPRGRVTQVAEFEISNECHMFKGLLNLPPQRVATKNIVH